MYETINDMNLDIIILNFISNIFDFFENKKVSKTANEIAKELKIEYPNESEEYIAYIVRLKYLGGK